MLLLLLVMVVPAVAAVVAYSRLGTRWGHVVTVTAAVIVLAFAVVIDAAVLHGTKVEALGGRLSADGLSALYLTLVAFVGLTSAIYAWGYLPAHGAPDARRLRTYYALFNLFLASLLAVPLLSDIVLVWIAIDLTTVLSAFLVAFESRRATLEAAWKYAMLTIMGALIALPGFLILVYALRAAGLPLEWAALTQLPGAVPAAVAFTAFIFILVGFGAKAGLVPMHTWLPDAHSQAPAPVCAVLSGVETTAAVYVLFRLFPLLWDLRPTVAAAWYIVPGLVSVGVAAFLLIQVRDFKRLFAFSTVEHMGILMVACGIGTSASHVGTIYQMLGHSLIKPFCFYAAGLAVLALGSQELSSARGLCRRAPLAGYSLLLAGLAIAGAPPFSIFISEVAIIRAGFDAGRWVPTALLVVFIVIAFSAIMYHLIGMTFGEPSDGAVVHLPRSVVVALVVAGVPALILGVYLPGPLATLVHQAAAALGGAP
jgi:hydrogenase-4 component F